MHCATLDIQAKVEYTLVSFVLSFCCPAANWPYLPFILRSFPLQLIFPITYMSFLLKPLLEPPVASFWALTGVARPDNRGGIGVKLG